MTVHATRACDESQKIELQFDPPMMSLGTRSRGFIYWWKMIQYVYALPNPFEFPYVGTFSSADTRVLQRFVRICEEVARSRLVNYPTAWSISLDPSPGGDKTSFIDAPDSEVMRAGAVTFRQLFKGSEQASFNVVRNLVARQVNQLGAQAPAGAGETLRAWRVAHTEMSAAPLPHIADEASTAMWQRRARKKPDLPDVMSTHNLAEVFSYGDLIHWGEHAATREAFGQVKTQRSSC